MSDVLGKIPVVKKSVEQLLTEKGFSREQLEREMRMYGLQDNEIKILNSIIFQGTHWQTAISNANMAMPEAMQMYSKVQHIGQILGLKI